MQNLIPALLIGSFLTVSASAFAAAAVHEGQWRYTMKIEGMTMPLEMKNFDPSKLPPEVRARMPKFDGNAMTMDFQHCLTEADLVPHQENGREHCKITRMDRHGGSVHWASICDTPRGKMNAEGTATYSGDTMTATTHMTGTGDDGKPMNLTQHITGQYVGACPK
ncbi:MAG TPA: DUF3617 domain-containing protein [Solimonas sp.]|nr:DUF3617 domain-containing protein [Solimonas sp.]